MQAMVRVSTSGLDVEYHLSLWAALSRQGEKVGWYREQPWYTPAGWRESFPDPTLGDLDMAERVGRIVLKMQQREPRRGRIVRLYYGAFPGAESVTKTDRIMSIKRELGVQKQEMFKELDAAKRTIEGAINYAS